MRCQIYGYNTNHTEHTVVSIKLLVMALAHNALRITGMKIERLINEYINSLIKFILIFIIYIYDQGFQFLNLSYFLNMNLILLNLVEF